MKLKSRKFILKDVGFSPNGHSITFIPEIVEGKEVYSIFNQNDEHCGYMTEDMLNTILKQNEKEDVENNIIMNSLFVDKNDEKVKPTTLAQKIIIDKFKGVTPLNIELNPVKYEENAKPLVMKVEEEYSIKNSGKKLGLDFINQETISCNHFTFFNKIPTDVNINIDSASSTFQDIRLFFLEDGFWKDHEINLYLSGAMMDSISITHLTFCGLSADTKGAYHLALEANGNSLTAGSIKVKLPAEQSKEGKYCKLTSLKKEIRVHNSDLTFLKPGSFLEVRKNIDLSGVALSIGGENKIDGDFKASGNQKEYGLIEVNNLKSYSTIKIATNKDDLFWFENTTLNNGKKNIVFNKGDTHLLNVEIENDGKKELILNRVSIRNSKIKNISNLSGVQIGNTEVENFTLNSKNNSTSQEIFSFGLMDHHFEKKRQKEESIETFCSLKNTVVELNEEDTFRDMTKGALHLHNSIVKGKTIIESLRKVDGNYNLTIDNSILNEAQISLTREDNSGKDIATVISTSEIRRELKANELREIKNSMIENSSFDTIYEINDSICESLSLDGKGNNTLNGYNSIDKEDKTDIGQVNSKLELL